MRRKLEGGAERRGEGGGGGGGGGKNGINHRILLQRIVVTFLYFNLKDPHSSNSMKPNKASYVQQDVAFM